MSEGQKKQLSHPQLQIPIKRKRKKRSKPYFVLCNHCGWVSITPILKTCMASLLLKRSTNLSIKHQQKLTLRLRSESLCPIYSLAITYLKMLVEPLLTSQALYHSLLVIETLGSHVMP